MNKLCTILLNSFLISAITLPILHSAEQVIAKENNPEIEYCIQQTNIMLGDDVRYAEAYCDCLEEVAVGTDRAKNLLMNLVQPFVVPHPDTVTVIAWAHPSTKMLVAGGEVAAVWDPHLQQELNNIKHEDNISAATFGKNGTWVITATDETVRITDLLQRRILQRIPMTDTIKIAVSTDGKFLFLTTYSQINCWDTDRKQKIANMPCGSINDIGATGKCIANVPRHNKNCIDVELLSTASMPIKPTCLKLSLNTPITAAVLSPNENAVLIGSSGIARLWDIENKQKKHKLPHDGDIHKLAWSPDGTKVSTTSINTTHIWDTVTGNKLMEITRDDDGPVHQIAFNPQGTLAATAHFGNLVNVWNIATGKLLIQLPHSKHGIGCILDLAFSPGGTQLLTNSSDGKARIWDIWNIGDPLFTFIDRATMAQACAAIAFAHGATNTRELDRYEHTRLLLPDAIRNCLTTIGRTLK